MRALMVLATAAALAGCASKQEPLDLHPQAAAMPTAPTGWSERLSQPDPYLMGLGMNLMQQGQWHVPGQVPGQTMQLRTNCYTQGPWTNCQ